MLYLDTDAVFSSSKYTTTSCDEFGGPNATGQHLSPTLIVNKPMTGLLCHQYMYIELAHGCFNTAGALFW